MEVLKKGSIESLLVQLGDRLENVVDLSTVTNLKFDTKKRADNSAIQTDVAVVLDVDKPMTAICEIDTTLVGYAVGADYKLYIKYSAGSESPILFVSYFRVEDD